LKEHRAPRIFVSGMLDARIIIQFMKDSGLSDRELSGEECSQNTEENGLYTTAILRPQGVQKILLVTDPPHMLRSLLVFRSFGFTVVPHLSPLPSDLSPQQKSYVVLREYAALAKYAVNGRFRLRTREELAHPPIDVLNKITDWNCRA
jgi:uncharacterized SAM-binding protein YcdF (DUF218 family)